ncbi:hypothetical protein Tco_0630167 [Tanacetum coccineum]
MNQEEIQQAARDQALVPTDDRVKIGSSNMRIDPTMTQNETTELVVSMRVDKEAVERQKKKKIKGIATDATAQELLNLKKGTRKRREDYILQQIPKGSSEGFGTKPKPKDKSVAQVDDWDFDEEEIILSSDDDETKSENETVESEKVDDEKANEEEGSSDDEVHTEEDEQTDDEAHNDEYVHDHVEKHDDADEEMNNAENADKIKDDQVMNDSEMTKSEKTNKEKVNKEQAGVDQTVKDDQGGFIDHVTQKEKKELPPLTSRLSLLSDYDNSKPIPTPLPTLLISSEAPTITTTIPDPLSVVLQRLSDIERKFESWTKVDHSEAIEESVQANIINEVKNQLPKFLPKAASDFVNPRIESIVRDVFQKNLAFLAQSSFTPAQPTFKEADSLFKYELKKILLGNMDKRRSYMTHEKHFDLYNGLSNSIMLDEAITSRDVNLDKVLKRDHGDDQDPTAGSDQGKKKKRKGKDIEPSKDKVQTDSSSKVKTQSKPSSTDKPMNAEEPLHESEMDVEEPILDDVVNEANQSQDDAAPKQGKPDWFKQPPRPPTPYPKWNKDKNVNDGPKQPWFNDLVYAKKDILTFNELMATPINFSKFAMNRLKLDKITKADLVGHVYKLLKGTCKSSIELEYNMDQCYDALMDQLDWTNLKGDRCLYDLSKPLPLQGSLGYLTIPVDFFFNNDLEYLRTRNSERKYTVSITKIKAASYELEFIKEMISKLWSPVKMAFSKHDVYYTMKILSVVCVKVDKQFGYGYLQEIVVRRVAQKLHTFKEGDFLKLHLNDIKDMLLLHVQNKLFNLDGDDIVNLAVALRMFTRRIVILKRVKDVRLGVESYQKRLNITSPQKEFLGISAKEPYTTSYNLKGVVYLNSRKHNIFIRADELYKFSDINYRLLNSKLGYNKDMPRRKWTENDQN